MDYPKISVVTPSYNQGKFLEETIFSVFNQDYPNLEYIIMDGSSIDNSVEIIKKYADKITYWQSKPDKGQSVAINEGFKHATGDIFCWLNSDDQYIKGALKTVGEYFSNHPDCHWLAGTGILKYVNNKKQREKISKPKRLDLKTISTGITNIAQPSVFWRKELWNQTKRLCEEFHYAMDFDLWVQFSKITEGHVLDDVFSIAFMYPEQKSAAKKNEYFVEAGLSLFRNGEIDSARKLLARPVKRAFEIDNAFKLITRNPLYRKWRDSKEKKIQV
jgi:glycosyltransferase involved in cell wall biosynthesis